MPYPDQHADRAALHYTKVTPKPKQTPGSTSDPGALRDDCSPAPLVVSRPASPVAAAAPNPTQGPECSDRRVTRPAMPTLSRSNLDPAAFVPLLCREGHRAALLPALDVPPRARRHALVPCLSPGSQGKPHRRPDRQSQADAASRPGASNCGWDLRLAAARFSSALEDRADRPRGAGPRRRPGNADADAAVGRAVADKRSL